MKHEIIQAFHYIYNNIFTLDRLWLLRRRRLLRFQIITVIFGVAVASTMEEIRSIQLQFFNTLTNNVIISTQFKYSSTYLPCQIYSHV